MTAFHHHTALSSSVLLSDPVQAFVVVPADLAHKNANMHREIQKRIPYQSLGGALTHTHPQRPAALEVWQLLQRVGPADTSKIARWRMAAKRS